eukprot:TRINITY_DN2857_c0_g1_i2.p4 TRINITY_DN2857_c0_g1~~TRINITY_DN2857_c0_g1_i2.p4  ORF type:complete len:102 (-),score=41.47 TRINITY_DN2857_c0_g1_i2:50-355(-)
MAQDTEVKETQPPAPLAQYTAVWFGAPVHAWHVSSPMRSWVLRYKAELAGKKFGFFATMGGSGDKQLFEDMQALLGAAPAATFAVLQRDVPSWEPTTVAAL